MGDIAVRLREVSAADGPEAILPYGYLGTQGLVQSKSINRRFFNRLGASVLVRKICAGARTAGLDATLGPAWRSWAPKT